MIGVAFLGARQLAVDLAIWNKFRERRPDFLKLFLCSSCSAISNVSSSSRCGGPCLPAVSTVPSPTAGAREVCGSSAAGAIAGEALQATRAGRPLVAADRGAGSAARARRMSLNRRATWLLVPPNSGRS